MYLLGLSSYSHEASCALIKDGEIRVVLEEERFNRKKHTSDYPANAIEHCLAFEGITIHDIDRFCFFWQPARELWGNIGHFVRYFPRSLNLLKAKSGGDELSFVPRLYLMKNIGQRLQRHFNLPRPPRVEFYEHHLCHASSAFHLSPFPDAAILTVDGRGESTSTMMAYGDGTKGIQKIKEINVPHSLGHLYAALTGYLGFYPFSDEWKVMGLSAYGRDTYVKDFEPLVRWTDDGGYRLNLDYFKFHTHGQSEWLSPLFYQKFGPARQPNGEYTQHHFDMAYALQHVVERTGVYLAQHLQAVTGQKNLCMAGGVVLNCLMNKRIVEETKFENFFFQPIANDAGTSLGSALYGFYLNAPAAPRHPLHTVYYGEEFSNAAIEPVLQAKGVTYTKSDNVARDTARHIAEGKIVGWFQGRMESGPRALGNRSITVDPTDPQMKDRLNARVKKREFYRPFAPSILEEKVDEYFRMPKGQLSPYMILIGDVREEKKSVIPAVTHADGTARVHTVNKDINPRYWNLIAEFEKIKGVPVLLNTSFNENEPIVATSEHAVNCFCRTEFDVLAIGDFIVTKD